MKVGAIILSCGALLSLVLSSILFLANQLPLGQMKTIMWISTIVWFVFSPLWILRDKHSQQ